VNFPLDDERTDQIIFAMEDQEGSYGVDPDTGKLQAFAEGPAAEDLVPIPEWGPADGFQLMERFVAGLRNPLVRAQLKEALGSGKGVFRKFKDILKGRPDIERLWFAFKAREMRQVVRDWYSDARELAGLERLPDEPPEGSEEAAELAAVDFALRPGEAGDLQAVRDLDRQALADEHPDGDPARLEALHRRRRQADGDPLAAGSLLRVLESPGGEFAGFFWAVEGEDPASGRLQLRLIQLAVEPAFRGMGLGALLLARLLGEARDRGCRSLLCPLRGSSLDLEGVLRRRGFALRSALYEVDPSTWEG
jgi:GNAT superfamily N-acetyltransferase